MNYEIFIAVIILVAAFFLGLLLTKLWISVARKNKLEGKDMNKWQGSMVAESGGIAVISSMIISIMLYIFFKSFVLNSLIHLTEILVLIVTLLLACFIGFIDDILGWKKGIKGWQKLLLTLPMAIPLMVINAGQQIMNVPFLGAVDFGLFYPLVIVPLGVMGATNGTNLLAGYNGLEAGLGSIIIVSLGLIALVKGHLWLTMIAGIAMIILLAFLVFNKYPAKVFPGDSLTYSLGALIACFAILGNMEKAAFLLFAPFIIEGILKARSRFKAENFAKANRDRSLDAPYKQTYSLTHAALKMLKKIKPSHKVYEREVVASLILLEVIIAALVLIYVL